MLCKESVAVVLGFQALMDSSMTSRMGAFGPFIRIVVELFDGILKLHQDPKTISCGDDMKQSGVCLNWTPKLSLKTQKVYNICSWRNIILLISLAGILWLH